MCLNEIKEEQKLVSENKNNHFEELDTIKKGLWGFGSEYYGKKKGTKIVMGLLRFLCFK